MMNINDAAPAASTKSFQIPEEGTHRAVLIRVIDLGVQEQRPFQGEPKPPAREVQVVFELPDEMGEFDGEEKPLVISETFKFSGDDRSKCYKRLTGMDPGMKKSKGDWTKLIGEACMLQVIHRTNKEGDRTYANIASVAPLMKGLQAPDSVVASTYFYNTEKPDAEVFEQLPQYLKDKINHPDGAKPNASNTPEQPDDSEDDSAW